MDTLRTDLEHKRLDSKLSRLQSYLESDPGNALLALETFEAAFALGRLDVAERSLGAALAQPAYAGAARFRLANLRIAQRRLADAGEILDALQREVGEHPGLMQTRALCQFTGSDFAQCAATLAPYVDRRSALWAQTLEQRALIDSTHRAELQMMWLRSLHRLGELDRAWAWTEDARATDQLTPAAAGVACLVALDAGQLESIEDLARSSGSHPACQQEVLLSLGSLALHRKDGEQARRQLNGALALNNANGRAWSTLGFVGMMESKLELAMDHFARALDVMPEHVGTWIGLGWTRLLAKGEPAWAKEAFQKALELDDNFAESHGCMAVVLALEGKRQDARLAITRAKRLDKRCWSSQFAQMIVDGVAGDAALVERLAQHLIESTGMGPRLPTRRGPRPRPRTRR